MTLHVVVRSYGGENQKRRPSYYSKVLTLSSVVRALARVPEAEAIFLNDGPVPPDRLALMQRAGRVVSLGEEPAGMRASYRAALALADTEGWPDEDVVAFVEDDYLFTEDAFLALVEAVHELVEVSYFSLYGTRPDEADPASRHEHSLPRDWVSAPERRVGERLWFNRASITSTFAARVGALRADLPIFAQCMRPFRRRFFDHETCLLYQGVQPYHGRELFFGLPDDFEASPRGLLRAFVLVPFRMAMNRTARRQAEPHLLYTVAPNLATHLEHPVISPDRDWAAVAAEVEAWRAEQAVPRLDPEEPA